MFTDTMVRAILDGRKRQTRRLVGIDTLMESKTPGYDLTWRGRAPVRSIAQQRRLGARSWQDFEHAEFCRLCPYGIPGDRIWVRETWRYYDWTEDGCPYVLYRADDKLLLHGGQLPESVGDAWAELSRAENTRIDGKAADRKWRPSMFMPRWASRITLEVTEVRAQRLASITEHEAELEGVASWAEFVLLWDSINAKKAPFESNPWVWAISFEVVS